MTAHCVRAKTEVSAEIFLLFLMMSRKKRKQWWIRSTMREQDKKNAKYYVGDYYFKFQLWQFGSILMRYVNVESIEKTYQFNIELNIEQECFVLI